MTIKKFEVELIKSNIIACNTKSLLFKKIGKERFNFIPGQFITFLLRDQNNLIKRRSYSIANIPNKKNIIEIAISYIKGGIGSTNLFNMKVGDKFTVIGPVGKLILKNIEKVCRVILVGTGTGITPYQSMLLMLDNILKKQKIEIYVLLGVQYKSNIIYEEDFRKYSKEFKNFYFKICLSREEKELESDEEKGYVQSFFKKINLNSNKDIVYLCGNPNMIDDSYELLIKKGFSSKNIRREKYISSN